MFRRSATSARSRTLPAEPRWSVCTNDPVAELALPAGKYAITATINAVNDDLNNANSIDCKLSAGADFDLTGVDLSHAPSVGEELVNDFGRLTLQVVHEFTEPGDASVSCGSFFAGRWSFLKITATRVATLSNGPLELVSP
jgi:hypothetical protein